MSWSLTFIGKPANVAAALDKYSNNLSGPSQEEYNEAKPHLIGLVNQIFASEGQQPPTIKLAANGSGYSVNGKRQSGSLYVSLENIFAEVV